MITVDVTAGDIRRGKRCRTDCCPVAIALGRATGRSWKIGCKDAVPATGVYTAILLPPAAVQWIDDFDHGRPVAPFSFEVQA